MNNAVCAVVSYALNALWQIPLIAGAGWISSRLLRRWGPRSQHVMWVVTLLLSLITPAFPICRAILQMATSSRGSGVAIQNTITAGAAGDSAARAALVLPVWMIWSVFALYVCTLTYFAMRLLWLFVGTRTLIRGSSCAILNSDVEAVWQRVRQIFAVGDVAILRAENIHGVSAIGAWRPAIVLPDGFAEQCTEHDFLSAMGHELAHVQRHDYGKNLFYEIASLPAVFHPVVWMVKAQIVHTREMICDAIVVEKLMDRRAYRQSLLRMAEQMIGVRAIGTHAVGIFDGNILEKRIMAMRAKNTVPSSLVRYGLSGCVAALLVTTMATSGALAKQVDGATTDHDAKWGKVYHVGGDVKAPVLKYSVDPEFPKSASVANGAHVVCVVRMIVGSDGELHDVHVARSAGKDFDASALRAVRQYRFEPARRDGKPVTVKINVEVDFKKY